MRIGVYAIRDSYLGFSMPLLRDNDSVASRAFEHDCKIDNSPYSTRSECFQLFHIGFYDTDTAAVESVSPTFICSASDFIGDMKNDNKI